LEAETLSR